MPWGGGGAGGGSSSQLINFLGFYDASTNTVVETGEHLANGTGTSGDFVITSVNGNNTPSGQTLVINQLYALNYQLIWSAGGIASNSDSIVVAADYVVIPDAIIATNQTITQALGATQGQINTLIDTNIPIGVVSNQNVNTVGMIVKRPYIYENIGSSIITLTFTGGGTLRNPPVLNGTTITAGLNPGDVFTFIKQSDNTILVN